MTKTLFIKFLLLAICTQAFAQKIKYKDVFGLLSTKQYDAAEPFLKKYLVDNTDNSNAYLFMGLIYQEKSLKDDVLKNTDGSIQHMDSAILFFDKAIKGIDEKELRKNKEYYVAYNRRDLRTGEFGVKLSDVQLDIENRMTFLRERIDKVKMVKYYFGQSFILYNRTLESYGALQDKFPGIRELYLRADESTIGELKAIAARYDSSFKAFENYRSSSSNLGRTGYSQAWNPREITDFKRDGKEKTDFFQDDLNVWNYKAFAEKTIEVINKEVKPVQQSLISYDIEINKLKQTLESDSVSVKNDLTKLVDRLLGDQLRKLDPDPLPMDIFAVKIAELNLRSSQVETRRYRDSSDVHHQVRLVENEARNLQHLDSVLNKVNARNIDEEALNYQAFITATYNRLEILKTYLRALGESNEREAVKINQRLVKARESVRWLINGADSIPLFTENNNARFKPVLVQDKKYTVGLVYADSLTAQAYFYNITPSHRPTLKIQFAVDKPNFKLSRLKTARSMVTDLSEQVYFILVYQERAVNGTYAATLAKVYRTDGLSWNTNLTLPFIPQQINVKQETGEIEILSGGEQKVTVDKNGKKL